MPALGANSTHASEFASKLGAPIEWNRVFAQTQPWTPTSGPWKICVDAAGRGEHVAASSKPPASLDSIASGAQNNFFKAIATGLAALPTPGVYTHYHEPEDNIEHGEFTASQFIESSKAIYRVMRPILQPKGWRLAVCLMGFTANGGNGRQVGTYFDTELLSLIDIIAWDPYNYVNGGDPPKAPWATANPNGGSPAIPPDKLFPRCVSETLSRGKTPMIFEVGCCRRQADTSGSERTAWWQATADLPVMAEFEAIMHFEMGSSDGKAETAIRNEAPTVDAFKRLGTVAVDPCAECEQQVKVLTGDVAELEQDKAELQTRVTDLQRANSELVLENAGLNKKVDDAAAILIA